MLRQIVLDTETTGLSWQGGHRVIEIGALELINRRVSGAHFHHYLNPEREIDDGALKVHGISNAFLRDKPTFGVISAALIEFIKGAELIIHNADFDLGFLNHELSLLAEKPYGQLTDHCTVLDTLSLARKKHPGQRNSLDALCKRYEVSNLHRRYHGALLDAEILAEVYLCMTGGQETLFFEEAQHVQPLMGSAASSLAPLRVVRANEAELKAHDAYLTQLSHLAGKSLWQD